MLAHSIVADLLRPDTPVGPDELIPTLLSESEDDLHAALNLFDPEQLTLIHAEAQSLVDQLQATGNLSPGAAAKLATIESHPAFRRQQT